MPIGKVAEDARVIGGGMPIGDLDMPPAFQWSEQHEDIGRAVALIFVIDPRGAAGLRRYWQARLGDQLL